MKRFFRIAAVAAMMLQGIIAVAAQKDTLRVLAIGNSFSQDAVEQNLHELAAANGQVFIIGNMYIGGCSVERHWNNAETDNTDYAYRKIGVDGVLNGRKGVTLKEAITDENWDVITLQQASHFSGQFATYEPYVGNLVKYIRSLATNKDVKLMWQQTWAYAEGATHSGFNNYERSQERMYEDIMYCSQKICNRYGFTVIPSGTTVQNVRQVEGEDVTRDGFHMNRLGRYAIACAWYEVLSGKSVVGNSWCPPEVYIGRAKIAQAAAHAAVARPYGITEYYGYSIAKATHNEADVPEYTLPDPLTMNDGTKVRTSKQWMEQRRPEVLEMFTREMYGRAPGRLEGEHFEVVSEGEALKSMAIRKEVRVYYDEKHPTMYMTLLIYLPKDAKGPVPTFIGMNFKGNHAITDDPGVTRFEPSYYNKFGIYDDYPRAEAMSRWPIQLILARGYGLVTWCRDEVDQDFDDGFNGGVHKLLDRYPKDDEWGTISAWAWSMSRAIDYIETDPAFDSSKIISIGHSRLGKTSLWAAANDQRIAMAISNDSGCGGAALSKRHFGETVRMINEVFPHWFCRNFRKYDDNEAALPFDQHELIALIAPRPVYVASSVEDLHADPKGEFLAAKEASKVYKLFGYKGLGDAQMPEANTPIYGDHIAYHIRTGAHDINAYDWEQYLNYADKYFKKTK